MKSFDPARFLRGWPFLTLAALLLIGILLALTWAGTGSANAQGDGAILVQASQLHVAITAHPANPVAQEAVKFRAIISNAPSEEAPSYQWQLHTGGDDWLVVGRNAAFSFVEAQPGSSTFRVTVAYDTGESATSDPLTVVWSEATPTPEPTKEPSPTSDPTEEPPEPPATPADLTATGIDAAIDLRWTDPSDGAISRYQVRVSADGGATWDPDWTDVPGSGAATTSHTLTDLTNDTEYTVELRAFRGETAGAAASATATPESTAEPTPTPEPTPEPTKEPPEPPAAPAALTATGGDAVIDLNWTDPSDDAISKYQVRVSADGGSTWDPDWTYVPGSGAATTSHTLTDLTNDTEYTVELRALRGETAGAAATATATPRPEPPPAPAGLTATGQDTAIDLSWTDPSDSAITGYQVRVSADGGSTWDPDWTDVSGSGPDTTSHRLTGLANDTEYTVGLRAVRGASSAGPAASATATPESTAGAQEGYEPDPELIEDVWEYARELNHGPDHVLRWMQGAEELRSD